MIRFDAAMTLAKRHFHRLWFPGPGASGAIPSRAEFGMSQAEFDRCMPHEFWREVVDRVAVEVPGTLLLAEAFWLMEGYFVRTLGMHRVYNSAFMNMMRDEENAKYRSVIKNTLEFDPDIMKRYVNFMSNPDERTAIDQFGTGDKCFGVAAVMATLPGLPMFGHGQIEGFTEKYGMEYQRPRYDETPDQGLVERHQREIAPLLQRRWLFAESSNFLLYDFYQNSGAVDENVFAYSNRNGGERALVVYNNRYGTAHGTIHFSAAYADKGAGRLHRRALSEGLGLNPASGAVIAWRDSLTGLEYLRSANDLSERGLNLNLHAYQCHVFLDWRELYASAEKPWDRLSNQLNGRGVPNLDDALVNLELRPVHDALRQQLDPAVVRLLADLAEHPKVPSAKVSKTIEQQSREFSEMAWTRCETFLHEAQTAYASRIAGANKLTGAGQPVDPVLLATAFHQRLSAVLHIPAAEAQFPEPWTVAARRMLPSSSPQFAATAMWGPVFGWCVLELLAKSIDAEKPERVALDLFDRLRLREPFARAFAALGFEAEEGWRAAARIKVLLLSRAGIGQRVATQIKVKDSITEQKPTVMIGADVPQEGIESGKPEKGKPAAAELVVMDEETGSLMPDLWLDPDVRWLTGVHEAQGQDYLVREPYEELLWWLQLPGILRLAGEQAVNRKAAKEMSETVEEALNKAESCGYRIDALQGLSTVPQTSEEQELVSESEAAEKEKPQTILRVP